MARLSQSRQRWPLDRQGGFTLIEVMMALTILTIGILAVVGIQYHIINGTTNGNVVSQQLHLAQRYMERYKNTGRSNLDKLEALQLVNVDHEGNPGGPYTLNIPEPIWWPIKNPDGKAKLITVTVTRSGGIGGHPITLRCLTRGDGV